MCVSVNDIAENTLAEWVYLHTFLKGIHPDYFSNPERCFLQDTRNISRSTHTLILCCVREFGWCVETERWINEGMNWRSNKLQLSHNRKRTKQLTITAPSEHIALILRLLKVILTFLLHQVNTFQDS